LSVQGSTANQRRCKPPASTQHHRRDSHQYHIPPLLIKIPPFRRYSGPTFSALRWLTVRGSRRMPANSDGGDTQLWMRVTTEGHWREWYACHMVHTATDARVATAARNNGALTLGCTSEALLPQQLLCLTHQLGERLPGEHALSDDSLPVPDAKLHQRHSQDLGLLLCPACRWEQSRSGASSKLTTRWSRHRCSRHDEGTIAHGTGLHDTICV
jgi:hypothetical protein